MRPWIVVALALCLLSAPNAFAADRGDTPTQAGLALEWLMEWWQDALASFALTPAATSEPIDTPSQLTGVWDNVGPGLVPVGSSFGSDLDTTDPQGAPIPDDEGDNIGPGLVPVG